MIFKNIKWKTYLSLRLVPLIHSISVFLQRIPDNKCCGTIYQKMRRQRMLKEEYLENQTFNTLYILSWIYGDLVSAPPKNYIQNLYYRITWQKEESLSQDSVCGESTSIYELIASQVYFRSWLFQLRCFVLGFWLFHLEVLSLCRYLTCSITSVSFPNVFLGAR